MKHVPPGEITNRVEKFLRAQNTDLPSSRRRERSWDFCFNHFQDHPQPTNAMDLSCLHLGYYLASWGMLRGSSFLFRETNARHYQQVIQVIEQHHPSLRGLDVHMYRDAGTRAIIDSAWDDLKAALLPDGGRSLTLVSKVMMGVWGCVPSYDTYFLKTFRELAETREERGAFSRAGVQSRLLMADLWDEHQDEIDGLRHRFPTLDLTTGKPTGRPLTRAKVIDIFAFQRAYSP